MALTALLDANTLWSAAVRDTLLLAAERDLYRPVWTRRVLDEMGRALKAKRPDLDPGRIDRTVQRTLAAFPEALIVKDTPPAPGFDEVLLPGEPERRRRAERARAGIALPATTWQELTDVAARFAVPMPDLTPRPSDA